MAEMPPATVEVSAAVVRCLIQDQRPDLAGRALVRVANGWDNATFRLGDDLAVRLPRRAEAVPLILHEQRYLPGVANRSPVPVPVPVHAGGPTPDFPGRGDLCSGCTVRRGPLSQRLTAARPPTALQPFSCPCMCPPEQASRSILSAACRWGTVMQPYGKGLRTGNATPRQRSCERSGRGPVPLKHGRARR